MTGGFNPTIRVAVWGEFPALMKRVRKCLSQDGLHVVTATSSADVVLALTALKERDDSLVAKLQRVGCPFVICTDPVDTPTLRWALDKGVSGVVWTTVLDETLAPTVRAARTGQLVFPNTLRRRVKIPDLTNREKQSLGLVIMGLTNREIADTLFISENTVKSHLNTAFRKLGVASRVEAAELITDPEEGLGMGILAITPSGHLRVRESAS